MGEFKIKIGGLIFKRKAILLILLCILINIVLIATVEILAKNDIININPAFSFFIGWLPILLFSQKIFENIDKVK
ncbi:MAG: hypothetical protein KGV59_04305 [Tenacibaculum sp.]|nr:hypothetical protein [Tenacibaculum sp.]